MNRRSLKLSLLLVVIPLFLLSLANILNPDRPTVSELENRTLKKRPVFSTQALFSGSYSRDYEEYFADTFIFRDIFAMASRRVSALWGLGRDTPTLVAHTGANTAEPQFEEPDPEVIPDDEQPQEGALVPFVAGDPSRSLLVLDGIALELHRHNRTYSAHYAATLNKFRGKVSESVSVFSLLAPTQIEFLASKRYRSLHDSQKATIDYINSQLHMGIRSIDAHGELYAHRDEYIFFRTDHHWTALGAYYAYVAFMREKGLVPVPLERYEVGQVAPFLGFLYSATLHESVRNNPDTVTFYKPFVRHAYRMYTYRGEVTGEVIDLAQARSISGKYGIFLSGDRPLGIIRTEVANGKKIAVVKDSYGNAFVPFLLPHYEVIYIIDPRRFPYNLVNFVTENQIDDVLFLNYVLVTENAAFANLLIRAMNR